LASGKESIEVIAGVEKDAPPGGRPEKDGRILHSPAGF
jgi:hypothetical protein